MKLYQVAQGTNLVNTFTSKERAVEFANAKNWFDRTWDYVVWTLEMNTPVNAISDNHRPILEGII